ncbi:MAG: LPS assembly lipoprotein LptE [Gallionella sp.]|nr:LPS assembly lipoprotein LptE [Gallionella sp.]MCK9354061.1 LPS assembly lipoprotein LptE [Gallionella sp.]
MRLVWRMIALLSVTLLLGACGFHPRGQAGMPFSTLYIDAAANTPFIAELRRNMELNNVKLVNSTERADLVLNIVFEIPEKQILSLAGSGRVNEYQLLYRVSLRAYDKQRQDWIPAEEMVQRREYSYSDAAILAKEAEEALLYKSMRDDMVQQIVRRLSRAKPQI